MADALGPSPYKFLDPYGAEDRAVFFGRERETRVLLSDVMVSRLVVLFARTGTGKTSLINAGVRPALEDRGYATFGVRVRQDPAESARAELLADPRIPSLDGAGLPSQMSGVVDLLEQPIVVFFDQFEEFFIYLMSRRKSRRRGRQFITDVAQIHADSDSGVHLVFSMREDFMPAMDDFREEIPTIFHQDSNLRLRWFDDDQARAAIVGPARALGATFDDELVDHIVADLRDEDGIEPAQVQIVCDTLWRQTRDGRVTLADYRLLGERPGSGTIAERILHRRIEEEFEQVQSRERLELLARLLPMLRTPSRTKYIRDLPSLARELETPEDVVRVTLERLETGTRLVRLYVREAVEYVELTHDYLVGHLDDLAAGIAAIWPRRVLRRALAAGDDVDATAQEEVEDVLDRVRAEHRRALVAGTPSPGDVALTQAEAAYLLRFALHAHVRAAVAAEVFEIARDHGASALEVVRGVMGEDLAFARTAVELVVALGREPSLALLPDVIARGDELAVSAVGILGGSEEPFVAELLADALAMPVLAPAAKSALTDLAANRRVAELADAAATLLVGHITSHLDDSGVASGIAELGRIEHPAAVHALERLLVERPTHRGDAHNALLRLAGSRVPAASGRAMEVLLRRLGTSQELRDASAHVVEQLASLDDPAVVPVLEGALAEPTLTAAAERALSRLSRSRRDDVAAAAAAALERHGEAPVVASPAPAPPAALEPAPRSTRTTPLDAHFAVVSRRLLQGRVIPFLGNGANLAGRPLSASWQLGRYLPTAAELSEHLARYSAFPGHDRSDVSQVAEYFRVMLGSGPLYDELREVFDADYPPTPLHRVIAHLPALVRRTDEGRRGLLLVTTNFDDALERAFGDAAEPCDVIRYVAHPQDDATTWLHIPHDEEPRAIERPNQYDAIRPDATVILKLRGGVDRASEEHDSYVLAEDDYLEYVTRADFAASLPPRVTAGLWRSHFLFLGHSLRDWNLRLLLRGLWRGQRTRLQSWAVHLAPDPIDRRFWYERDIEVLDMPLSDYVDSLQEALASLVEAPP